LHRDFHRTLDLKSEIIPRCGGRDIKVRRERRKDGWSGGDVGRVFASTQMWGWGGNETVEREEAPSSD